MRKFTITACALIAALACAQVATVLRNVDTKPQFEGKSIAKPARKAVRARVNTTESLNASFTVQGKDAQRAVWSENFDAGSAGWTITPDKDKYVTVKLKPTTGTQAFSAIDPNDVQSLYMEGPYQTYRRAIAYATSPAVIVPANGALHAWIGYSQNFNDYAVLSITASADDFATSTEVWNSTMEVGENSWRWHNIEASLADFVGQQVQLRFTYGPGTKDSFKTGGYMADFSIDGVTVDGLAEVDGVKVKTGETINFVDISTGDIASRKWSFPGGTPSESNDPLPAVFYREDGNYDVTLTVTGTDGKTSTSTRSAFVSVTGEAPVARIMPPATFRYSDTYLPMVAPLVPVQYQDASSGCPTRWNWTFAGANPATSTFCNPSVAYDFMHQQHVDLTVANQHGTSTDALDVSVEYDGYINNQLKSDYPVTYDLEGSGTFPGANTMKINAYGERFSKPSRPVMVYGALVFFETASAQGIADQIANIGVHLYTAKDGLPDKKLDSFWWRVIDVETSTATTLRGTWFECGPKVVDDEFFIVVDGIPEKNDSLDVSFATAALRAGENTAYMRVRDTWRPVAGYFDVTKGTSFYIWPAVAHSVISLLPVGTDEIRVPAEGGTIEQQIFSIFGYDNPAAAAGDWATIVSKPNELTLDTLAIQCEPLPAGINSRRQVVSITDRIKASTISFTLVQERGIDGDVNGDGSVDVDDVNTLINVILTLVPADKYDGRADVNHDGNVDIDDLNIVINKILFQ
ncbi:MAG: PKD domain-containing protein [Bacteroidales bacterium]|nr:PKD domain-containing protein [Candidatus Sodaliphilus limicaballi]